MHGFEKQFNLDGQKSCNSGRVRRQHLGLYMSSLLNSVRDASLNPDAMARLRGLYRDPQS